MVECGPTIIGRLYNNIKYVSENFLLDSSFIKYPDENNWMAPAREESQT